jgi:hypothetical protein
MKENIIRMFLCQKKGEIAERVRTIESMDISQSVKISQSMSFPLQKIFFQGYKKKSEIT